MEQHVILTLGRSGSNTLRDMINQSPDALNFGEVLGDWNSIRTWQKRLPFIPNDNEAFLDWVLTQKAFIKTVNAGRSLRKYAAGEKHAVKSFRQIKTFGIKDFSRNFHEFNLENYLIDRPHIKVVGLIRPNVIDRMLSNAMLGATGVIEVRQTTASSRKTIHIDPSKISSLIDDIETENAALEHMLALLPDKQKHILNYDDLFGSEDSRQSEMTKVFEFLGVQHVHTQERMKKIIRTPINEVIENFDECLTAVEGTPHAKLLLANLKTA